MFIIISFLVFFANRTCPLLCCFFSGFLFNLYVFSCEAFAVMTKMVPNIAKWLYRTKISNQISTYSIEYCGEGGCKEALLFLHGRIGFDDGEDRSPILLLHGDHSHPFTMLSLADISQNSGKGPVFSVYLPYDDINPDIHQSLLKLAVSKIEEFLPISHCTRSGIICVGHSKGAIEAANMAFVDKDPRIKAVISIAGRLKDVPSLQMPCHRLLKPIVEKVYQSIIENPYIPLYQIVAGEDWNAPLEATAVRIVDDCCHIVENSMHLNILVHEETYSKFDFFLKKI